MELFGMSVRRRPALRIWLLAAALLAACADQSQQAAPAASPQPAATAQATLAATAPVPPTTAPPTATAPPTPTAEPATATPIQATALEGQALVDALRRGGYVIYFRHAATDQTQTDSDLSRCETQRNLDDRGRAEARAIGQAFKALNIPVGQVFSSSYCRTRDTAELAFGRAEVVRDISGLPDSEREQRTAALRRLLSAPPQPGTNTVLVSHGFNITAAANITIAEGEAAIFAPGVPEGFALIARVLPDAWSKLVEEAVAATPPAQATPAPTASAQAAAAVLQEYAVPPGSHPHDVAPAPDGGVWYTAQASGELGRLDPASGTTRHVKLGEGSAPHGVIVGPDGAPWITDGGLNAILRVDPASLEVRRFPLPAGRSGANLNTATFDRRGVLWFTGQSGIYGRLDPAAGAVEVFDAPHGRGPYGITTTPDGAVYYASLAGSHIARIDPETGAAQPLEPPTPGQGARRVWSDSHGRIWVSEWNAGQVAMYDPATEGWKEWKLPGSEPHAYAVYVDDRDIVWLSDFGANTLVRFDPAREAFESFPLPSTPANVRQILGRRGEVWGAESAADKLVVIRQQ
jgi:virginiamycin B lyase